MKTDDLPSGWNIEIWGDSTVWIVDPNGRNRMRLREYLDDPTRGIPTKRTWQ